MIGDIRLLLVRPDDLVVFGLHWIDMTPGPPAMVGGPPVLVADGPRPTLVLTLPPQSTAEELFEPASEDRPQARVSGPSELRVRVAPGEQVELSVAGLLARLRRHQGLDADLELPWGLHLAPVPKEAGDPLVVDTPVEPAFSPFDEPGLWRARVGARHGLFVRPLPPAAPIDDGGGPMPTLRAGDRARIIAEAGSTGILPTSSDIELTALGGSATLQASWPTYSWEHDIRMGRDMRVRVESTGVLYPFGHRAVLAKLTERVLEPPDGSIVAAGLRSTDVLLIAEPLCRTADHGAPAAREFPFAEVEVLGTAFAVSEDHGDPKFYRLPAKRLDQLRTELDQLVAERDAQQVLVDDLLFAKRADVEQATADAIAPLEIEQHELGRQVDELLRQEQEFLDFQATHPPASTPPPLPEPIDRFGQPTGPTEPPPEEPQPPPRPDLRPVPGMERRIDELGVLIQAERDRGANLLVALQSEDGLALVGEQAALDRVRQLRQQVIDDTAHLRQVEDASEVPVEGFAWPLAPDGTRLRLPVRCDAVVVSTEVIFVHDIDLQETDDFPAFATLGNPQVRDDLATAWGDDQASRVPLPGVQLDLVRSASPRDGDVQEVHELRLAAVPANSVASFRPQVAEALIDLPAVRTMLPGKPSQVPVVFDPDFIAHGDVTDVALRLRDRLKVDFTDATDRVGGLAAPAFAADVLSRSQGLVDEAMLSRLPRVPGLPDVPAVPPVTGLPDIPSLPTGPPNLATVFKGAKLLGIPLSRVMDGVPHPVAFDGVLKPLGPTPVVDGGRPVGARMAWDVKLKDGGPLRVTPTTTFRMTAEYAPAGARTTCRAENFRLVLPPGTGDLIHLDFASLVFEQKVGHASKLEVTGLKVTLGGDLGLLKTLQDELKLGDAAPVVTPSPTGISASYSLAIPQVVAGAFVLRNIAARVGVEVPFDGRPVVATLGFASRENPFTLSVTIFGGSGYLNFQIAEEGIRQLEASLDFGATVAIGVGIATAEVHALGGVRFELRGEEVKVSGFLRIGGSVDVLGLVSVSVELRVELTYDGKVLEGRATAVVEVDVTFWHGAVHLDSGTFTLAGAMASPDERRSAELTTSGSEPTLPDWQRYRNAFAPSQP